MAVRWTAVALCLLAAFVAVGLAARKKSPLLEENAVPKKPNRVTECQFGKQLKEIGSTWYADLGPPFGVMYCIKCECVQVQKKRRIIGRTQCRNIKNDCPKPNCEEPTILPGKCCKTCPGEDANEFVQDPPDEEEKSLKHFAAVLTGQSKTGDFKKIDMTTSSTSETGLDHVSTGRFTFYRKHLYFSFYINKPDRPRMVQFNDANGNIIEEITLLPGTVYQNLTNKICGVWRRVSKDYKRLLREEKISVSLVWDTAIISGHLFRYKALDTESFSSLMTGQIRDTGGTAIVSISTISPSIHMQIVFNGGAIAAIGQDSGSFSVKLKYTTEDKRTVIEETIRVEKLTNKSITVEVRSPVTFSDLNALSRRDLIVILESKQQPGFKLQGLIVPRVFCDLYQAVVVTNGHQTDPKKTRTSGVAWTFINKDGALEYRIKFDNNAVTELAIASVEPRVSAIDLSESVVQDWSNGTFSTMGPVHLEQLYAEELSLVSGSSGFRGRLSWRPVADARDSAGPMLLSNHDDRSTAVGLLWAIVDSDCTLQYEVVLSGSNVKNRKFELYIEDSPLLVHGAPVFRRLLEEFEGPTFEGYVIGLSQEELLRLNVNLVTVDLWDPKLGQSVLKTEWKHVHVPTVCFARDASENDSNNILMNNDESEQHTSLLSCFHGQKYYQHGAQWTSTVDECYMCNCHYGRVTCDLIICPIVQCPVPSAKPGTCCPTCEENVLENQRNSTNSCWLAGQQFQGGSSWHPYLPPNGFDTCTLCHCNSTSLKIKCQRMDCPPLECDQRVAIRPTKRSCCKACPSTLQTTSKPAGPLVQLTQGDQQSSGENGSSDLDVLSNGGCSYPVGGPYENGQEWHPKIYSHGEVKCINCKCKDGKVRCDRKKCPKWSSCSDPCCTAACRRHKRQLYKL